MTCQCSLGGKCCEPAAKRKKYCDYCAAGHYATLPAKTTMPPKRNRKPATAFSKPKATKVQGKRK